MTYPRQPFAELQSYFATSHDHGADAYSFASTSGTEATATVTCDANTGMTALDTVTLCDGIQVVTYCYEATLASVPAGQVQWHPGAGTADQNSLTLKTAINAHQPLLSVVDNGSGVLTITNLSASSLSNTTLNAKSSASGVLAVTQFTGGVSPATTFTGGYSATTTVALETLDFVTRFDLVELINFTGFAASSTDYWTIALKAGANTVASWSTHSTAQGALTANVAATMVLNALDVDQVGAAGALLELVFTKTGSPVNFPAGRVRAHGRIVA